MLVWGIKELLNLRSPEFGGSGPGNHNNLSDTVLYFFKNIDNPHAGMNLFDFFDDIFCINLSSAGGRCRAFSQARQRPVS